MMISCIALLFCWPFRLLSVLHFHQFQALSVTIPGSSPVGLKLEFTDALAIVFLLSILISFSCILILSENPYILPMSL